jgi:hypothetical protein
MTDSQIDIFCTESDGSYLWRGTASSLEEATERVRELAKSAPGDYLAVNLQSGEKIKIDPNSPRPAAV